MSYLYVMRITSTPKAAVAAVFNGKGEVLVVQRRTSDKIGLPGGKVEGEESAKETVLRETLEETGYRVRVGDFMGYEVDADGYETSVYLCEVVGHSPEMKKAGEPPHRWADPADLYGGLGAYPEFNRKHVPVALAHWSRLAAGKKYRLRAADQSVYVRDMVGHLDYGSFRLLGGDEKWYMVTSVWSKIPFFLEEKQILSMDPVAISEMEYALDQAEAAECRSLIGKEGLSGWDLVRAAKAYAYERHNLVNQRYAKKYLYTKHLKDVFDCASRHGANYFHPEKLCELLALAYVHDVIEDCGVTYNDVKRALGKRLAEASFALTNDKGKTREERAGDKYYAGIKVVPGAKFGKLCDRLANVRMSGSMLNKYAEEFESFQLKLRTDGEYSGLWEEIRETLKTAGK